jgi:hypothetical protein
MMMIDEALHMNPAETVGSKKSPRITVSLPPRDYTVLTELAERHDVSMSWLTRQALVEFIEKYRGARTRLPLYLGKH